MVNYRSLISVPTAVTMNRRAIVGIWLRHSCAGSPAHPLADRFRAELSLLSSGPLIRLRPYSTSLTEPSCPPSSIDLDGHGTDKHRFWLHLGPNKALGGTFNHRE